MENIIVAMVKTIKLVKTFTRASKTWIYWETFKEVI